MSKLFPLKPIGTKIGAWTGHSHIGSYQGCAARMGEFSRSKTCGWV